MFDLIWIKNILKGIFNLGCTHNIQLANYQEITKMEKDLIPHGSAKEFTDEEKEYILLVCQYFNIKIYKKCKLIKQRSNEMFSINI
jgi:hypothetical protein